MKNALLINEGYSDNLGDQAINKSVDALFRDLGFQTSFLYFSKPAQASLPNYQYRKQHSAIKKPSKFSNIKGIIYIWFWLHKNKKAVIERLKKEPLDVVAFGGGQLINSSGKLSPSGFAISLFWITKLIKKYSNAKIFLIGVGSSGNFGKVESYLYKKAMKRIDGVWVRDQYSREVFKSFFRRDARVIPDLAFYNSSGSKVVQAKKENLALISITSYDEVFLKYFQGKEYSKDLYFQEIYGAIKDYRDKGSSVKLFYTTLTDAQECVEFKEWAIHSHKNEIEICEVNDLESLSQYFDNASFVYSARMHALILGMKSGCEVKAFLISQKLRSFNEEYILSSRKVEALSEQIHGEFSNQLK